MTGILIADAIGLLLAAWILNLIRKGGIYTGYGSALLAVIVGIICIASTPARFTEKVTQWIGTVMPRSLAVFLAIYCVLAAFVFVLREITVTSGRLRALTQQLAIELATRGAPRSAEPLTEAGHDSHHAARLSHSRDA